MEIGERIKQRRIQIGMTQEELAKKCGYTSKTTIAKIEANANQLRQSKIAQIAHALGTTPSYIMGWSDELTEDAGELVVEMMTDEHFASYVKKLYYADAQTKAQVYSLIDFALSKK